MSKRLALVTGAGGEMGHAILPALRQRGFEILAVDLKALPEESRGHCLEAVEASILDADAMDDLFRRRSPERVFHLAAVLSRKAEEDPDLAHRVNVEGTHGLLRRCAAAAQQAGRHVRVLFPSSIAVYGLPGAAVKRDLAPVKESEWTTPTGMYGCNKLYCEMLGAYTTRRAAARGETGVDFRSIRFPGLISADTLPTGGTSDYASEMIHAAAQGKPYHCFVREDARLPFMTMPDAVDALLQLADVPGDELTTRVYNIRAFSPSAGEIREAVLEHFPDAEIDFRPDPARQAILDTWPGDVDDARARRDWGLSPRHGLREAMSDYLVPALRRRYGVEARSR